MKKKPYFSLRVKKDIGTVHKIMEVTVTYSTCTDMLRYPPYIWTFRLSEDIDGSPGAESLEHKICLNLSMSTRRNNLKFF